MKNSQKKNYIITFTILTILTLVGIFAPFFNSLITKGLGNLNILSSNGNLLVHFINVGQGDAIAINLPDNKTALIDTGLKETNIEYADYLTSKVVNNNFNKVINYLILTHADADHIGGTLRLLENFDVKTIYFPALASDTITFKELEKYIKDHNYDVQINTNGMQIVGKNYKFEFFGPLDYIDSNDSCPTIKLTCFNKSFLFTGDITEEQEAHLLLEYGTKLDSDVLKVAHHGSKYSSTINFLQAVSPSYAVISCGKNDYGHPASTTLTNLQDVGAQVFRTDVDNNILFKLSEEDGLSYYLSDYTIVALKIDISYLILIADAIVIFYFVKGIIVQNKKNKIKN